MKLLVLIGAFVVGMLIGINSNAQTVFDVDRTVVYDGVTIVLPEDASLCVYNADTCLWGFTVKGQFPGLLLRDAIQEALAGNGLVLDYPLCGTGLVVSPGTPFPCYELALE